jgi:hypothetical protein
MLSDSANNTKKAEQIMSRMKVLVHFLRVQLNRYKAVAVGIVSGAAVFSLFTLTVFLLDGLGRDESNENIAVEWSDAVARLGISPVYPPEEDVAVGDVFAVVTTDRKPGALPLPLTARSVKLFHVDMAKDLDEVYGALPQFAETAVSADNLQGLWPKGRSDNSAFAHEGTWRRLPLAVFPEFTFSHASRARASVLWPTTLVSAVLGSSIEKNDTVELRVGGVETYGVPNIYATGHLIDFCTTGYTQTFCTDTKLRSQLSMVIDQDINEKVPDPKDGRNPIQRFEVQICLISRVFQARSIRHVRFGDRSLDSDVDVKTRKNYGGSSSNTQEVVAAGTNIRDVKDVEIDEVFPHPVVIGFRAAWSIPFEPAAPTKSLESESAAQ